MYLATVFNVAAVVLAACFLVSARAFYVRFPDGEIDNVKRSEGSDSFVIDKRYTKSQDAAIEMCAGVCMYNERQAYGDCYNLCSWTGKGVSPWIEHDRQQANRKPNKQEQQQPSPGGAAMAYRTGGLSSLGSSRGRPRGQRSDSGTYQPSGRTRVEMKAPKNKDKNGCLI